MFPPGEGPSMDLRHDHRELFDGLDFKQGIKTVADYRLRADQKSIERGLCFWYGGLPNP